VTGVDFKPDLAGDIRTAGPRAPPHRQTAPRSKKSRQPLLTPDLIPNRPKSQKVVRRQQQHPPGSGTSSDRIVDRIRLALKMKIEIIETWSVRRVQGAHQLP
jgi:hypothetical protein